MGKVRITVAQVTVDAELFDTPCSNEVARILPLHAVLNEWGDEFYFTVPVTMSLDRTATTMVKAGDIGYWPPGRAVAIFFGPTPMSDGIDPVPYSEVNVIGRITGDVGLLREARGAGAIAIEPLD